MRIASFNVENLFSRARVLERDQAGDGPGFGSGEAKTVLDLHARANAILRKDAYTAADKAKLVEAFARLGLERSDESALVILRQNRGKLVRRPRGGGMEIVAGGRADWIGWLDLKRVAVNEVATRNTAQVIRDVAADLLVVVEAEDRIALCRFNDQVLPAVGAEPYGHIMLVDGNDERGIDVGLMSREGLAIDLVRSHVDDRAGGRAIFSRDCPEYYVNLPGGQQIVVLANHLKSKGFGRPAESNARRLAQATRIREIYEGLKARHPFIAIAGDLNDTPDSAPLAPLFAEGSDLRDISTHPAFDDGGRPGTYRNGTRGNRIDFILMSPALFAAARGGGYFRKGVWGGANGTLWEIYPEMTREAEAASDHAAVWADLDL